MCITPPPEAGSYDRTCAPTPDNTSPATACTLMSLYGHKPTPESPSAFNERDPVCLGKRVPSSFPPVSRMQRAPQLVHPIYSSSPLISKAYATAFTSSTKGHLSNEEPCCECNSADTDHGTMGTSPSLTPSFPARGEACIDPNFIKRLHERLSAARAATAWVARAGRGTCSTYIRPYTRGTTQR